MQRKTPAQFCRRVPNGYQRIPFPLQPDFLGLPKAAMKKSLKIRQGKTWTKKLYFIILKLSFPDVASIFWKHGVGH
jgi:hypothetical protein